jgi:antitoxin (DNA-binding transcriptional repressor) of toxin-antitoxin stability system
MAQFNIAEAKSHFSELVQKALLGEEVVIARDNKPLLKLVPLNVSDRKRRPGSAKGKIVVSDAFFEPMSEEELKLWE